jgi:hypothetical protein
LGLAEDDVRHIGVPKRSLLKPSINKGMDLRSYVGGINRKRKKEGRAGTDLEILSRGIKVNYYKYI